jgi:signal transduction histidine kinase
MDGTDSEKGNSIGLMLCKEFVERNEGKIWVESELGRGTNFYVSFKQ